MIIQKWYQNPDLSIAYELVCDQSGGTIGFGGDIAEGAVYLPHAEDIDSAITTLSEEQQYTREASIAAQEEIRMQNQAHADMFSVAAESAYVKLIDSGLYTQQEASVITGHYPSQE